MRFTTRRVGVVFAVLALTWALGSRLVPSLVERAWAGQGPAFVARVAAALIDDPPYFSERWTRFSWTVTVLILALGGLVAAGVSPAFQAWVETRHGRATTPPPSVAFGRSRAALVQAAIGLALGLSLFSTITTIEFWPFSPYRMYATTQGPTFELLRIYGVSASGPVDLGEVDDAVPFDRPRFQRAMRRLLDQSGNCEWFERVARYAIGKYAELHPADDRHRGPYRVVTLEHLTWDLSLPVLTPEPASRVRVCAWTPPTGGP
jgi:hypothetical protein